MRAEVALQGMQPALQQAEHNLNEIDKFNLGELVQTTHPSHELKLVMHALLAILEGDFNGEALKWSQAKQRVDLKGNKLNLFVRRLQEYRVDENDRSNQLLAFLPPIVEDPEFEQAAIAGSDGIDAEYRSANAGALLCSWVRNIYVCHQLYEKAKPVIRRFKEAQAEASAAKVALAGHQAAHRQQQAASRCSDQPGTAML